MTGTYQFADSFEEGLGNWTLATLAGTNWGVGTDANQSFHLAHSLYIWTTNSATYPSATTCGTMSGAGSIIEWDWRFAGIASTRQAFFEPQQNGVIAFYIRRLGGILAYNDGAWHDFGSITYDQWHHIKLDIDWAATTYDIYLDNILEKADAGFKAAATSLDKYIFWGGKTGGGCAYYIDRFVYGSGSVGFGSGTAAGTGSWEGTTAGSGTQWAKYNNDSIIEGGGQNAFTSIHKEGTMYHGFYTISNDYFGHATSLDGVHWVKDKSHNPILTKGTAGEFDGARIVCPIVWEDDGTWKMLYTGRKEAAATQGIGFATATAAEGSWVKYGTNPVLQGGAGSWDEEDIEGWGLQRVGTVYYLWYNRQLGAPRKIGLATGTNLINWERDSNNPIFGTEAATGTVGTLGRFCPAPFKYDGTYYIIVPQYTYVTDYTEFELYKDTVPTFYYGTREFVKIIREGTGTDWDYVNFTDVDTPLVLTPDISRVLGTGAGTELWCYYSGYSGSWTTGLFIETDVSAALNGAGTGETPVATLSGTPTLGTIPLTVQFNDDSTGTPTSWLWTFGDGTNGTTENPPHDYLGTGSFTIVLEVSNADGTDSATNTDYIITGLAPTASFSGTPTSGTIELGVQFTFDGTGSPDNYLWNFGNGTISTQSSPSATYTTMGNYTIVLTVDNYWGTDTATKTNYIVALGAPIATFTGTPLTGVAPLTSTFTDLSVGTPTSWSWDFGDGTTATTQNPTHTFPWSDTYDISLWASNAYGTDTATEIAYVTVENYAGHWQLRFRHLASEDYLIAIEDMADYPNEMYQEEIGKDEYTAEEGGFYQYTHWNKKKCKFHFMDVDKDCMGTMQIFALGTQAFAVYAGTYATSYGNLLGTFYYNSKLWKPTETIDGLFNFDFPIREK